MELNHTIKLTGPEITSLWTHYQSDSLDVTDSTVPPFSDKLMMYLTGFLFGTAIAYFGAGLGATMRSDLVLNYEEFILEDLKLAEDWTDLMVKNQWMEQASKSRR